MENNEFLLKTIQTFEKKMEIAERLKSEEAQKALKLLETAMSHLEARRVMKNSIGRKINGIIKKEK